MAIPGQEQINVSNTENQSSNSDSLFTAFHKIQNNFSTLFSAASPFNTFAAGAGISARADAPNSTITFTNTGVASLTAGAGIVLSNSNGAYTISTLGNSGSGVANINFISNSLTITGSAANGSYTINDYVQPITVGTYSTPTITVNKWGKITAISETAGAGTVTGIDVVAGPGMVVYTSSGTITVTNTGVTKLLPGTGLISSSPDGNGDITLAINPDFKQGIQSFTLASNTLSITNGTLVDSGTINIELPEDFSLGGVGNLVLDDLSASQNVFVGNVLTVTGTALFGGNITSINATLGNLVTSNYFAGSGNLLSNIVGGNITGQVANSLVSGTVYTNAQPNITSVGTLVSANITGNISSGNANLGNLVTANYHLGNGSLLTSITGANVTGQVANSLVTGTVYTNAQPNITSVGTLVSANVTGNITAGNVNVTHTINAFDSAVANLLIISNTGDLMFNSVNNNNKGVVLQAPNDVTGADGTYIVWSLPNTSGNVGQFLTTDGAGTMNWKTIASSSAPSTATSSGSQGQIAFDATHIYVCIAANSWIRASAASW
jgi:hypothetical protein